MIVGVVPEPGAGRAEEGCVKVWRPGVVAPPQAETATTTAIMTARMFIRRNTGTCGSAGSTLGVGIRHANEESLPPRTRPAVTLLRCRTRLPFGRLEEGGVFVFVVDTPAAGLIR